MEGLQTNDMIGSLDFHGLKKLREEASRRIRLQINARALRLSCYVGAEIRDDFDAAVKYAHEKRLISKPSKWMFCKMAVHNAVFFLIEERKKEDLARAQAAVAMSSQMVYSGQSTPQPTPDTTKTA